MLRNRCGFTLIEIAIVLALIAILAGAMVPQVVSRLSQGEAAAITSTITTIRDAVLSFRGDVGRYPSSLTYLRPQPASGTDSCARSIPSGILGRWKGPYVIQTIGSTGMPVATGTLLAAVRRTPSTYSATGTLFIDVSGVDRDAANEIEASFDGNANLTAGTIRWTANSGPNRGTLSYAMDITGC